MVHQRLHCSVHFRLFASSVSLRILLSGDGGTIEPKRISTFRGRSSFPCSIICRERKANFQCIEGRWNIKENDQSTIQEKYHIQQSRSLLLFNPGAPIKVCSNKSI